ncbi:hypothetical protein [Klenkia taihuensis]|uniref:Uncharacterized protein n=1 Tax=Klenkia taihuensis TaxID=1225127 RepID=A0A1I1JE63_9ACTN|nr:hypothetical protein [Klenkia taihuensis]GHE10958.1 hypothetical protein GCM10011381_22420 [Klenkia taihuensis]SFC46736.1 hypothetical protein SAMN05661030_1036 [Klenkia taihuensis]
MSTVLPPPVPLPDPEGDPHALAAAVDGLAAAGFVLGVLEAHLAGPATQAPGWLGADAAAAAAEVGATRQVVGAVHDAVTAALGAVAGHREAVVAARARIVVLRDRQAADLDRAELRLATLVDPAAQVSSVTEDPAAAALVADVVAADAARAAEHAALLASVGEDAAVAAAALGAAAADLGVGPSRGGASTADGVRLHLAVLLPAYGAAVRSALGTDVAVALTGAAGTDEVARVLDEHAGLLADPLVAGALVERLGAPGLQQVLLLAGPDDRVAGGLAVAFTAAASSATRAPGLLSAVLDPLDPDGVPDQVALGMGAVVAAGGGAALAAGWLPSLLAREREQGLSAADRVASRATDPVAVVVGALVGSRRSELAAGALDTPAAWTALLSRPWADGGAALADLVGLAARDAAAPVVATAALLSAGAPFVPGGDHVVTALPATWARVAPELAAVVAAHPDLVVARLLDPAAPGAVAVLAGATALLAERAAARVVVPALEGAVATLPAGLDVTVLVGALTAVRDQAATVAHLVGTARADAAAVDEQFLRKEAELVFSLLPGTVPLVAGPVVDTVLGAVGFGVTDRPAAPLLRGAPGAVADATRLVGAPGGAGLAYEQVLRALRLPAPLPVSAVAPPDVASPLGELRRGGSPVARLF